MASASPPPAPAQRRHLRRSTKRILLMLAALLVLLAGIYFLLQASPDLSTEIGRNQVLLFVLFYVDVVLILAIGFVLARNLFKLAVERRHRILGAKFKSKLVFTYVGLSLIPVLLLFFYGKQLLEQSIEHWFAAPVREVLEQGSAVAQAMQEMVERQTQLDATAAARVIADLDVSEPGTAPALEARLRDQLATDGLDLLVVYQGTELRQGIMDPQTGLRELPGAPRDLLQGAAETGRGLKVRTLSSGAHTILAAAVVEGPGGAAPTIVVAGRVLPPTLAQQSEELIRAFLGFRQFEQQKAELTASQLLLFLLVTLLILFASSWVGLYLARRVTVPIQALADGTRRIGRGDLSTRVTVEADDELGVLVDSFNRMAAELERNEQLLERGNAELTATNRRLAEERALFVAVLQNVAAGVVALDERGTVFLVNGAALGMLRQTEGEVRGRPVTEAWADPERGKLLRLLEGEGRGTNDGTEVRLLLGGEWRTFEVKQSRLLDQAGEAQGRVVVLEELTELIRAQQLAAWKDAARRIAHEIKNPLTPIQLAAERVRRKHRQGGDGLGEAIEDGVEVIVREVDNLKAMVDEFSRYARMPHPQPVAVDLPALVRDVARLYQAIREGVTVEVDVAEDARTAWADPELLRGALINLLDNAVQAMEGPGEIRIAALARGATLVLQVADTGRGIPPAAKAKLFLPHFSTKGRGTGLGLAIVHRIVADHHGTIRVEDNEPQGTVFTIELPLGRG